MVIAGKITRHLDQNIDAFFAACYAELTKTTMHRRRLAAWAGMIGPALFVAIFTLEGWLRPGYEPLTMLISDLQLGPRGWIQDINFVVLGVLFLVFTRGVAAEFQKGKASRFGPILLTIIGIGFLASGPLVPDPVTTLPEPASWHGTLHWMIAVLVFFLIPVSCFVFLRRFREEPKWQWLQWWTLAAGTITTAALIVMFFGPTEPPAAPNAFNEWAGLIQRTFNVTYLSWIFALALGLRRQGNTGA